MPKFNYIDCNWLNWLTLCKVLNDSNSHCYLHYCQHNPTTDINTFNATAFYFIVYVLLIVIRYAIDID